MAEDKKYNITIECGADFVLPFVWYDSNGTPYDLTGATVEAQLREYSSSPDPVNFFCTHNGKGGRITISLPQEQTSGISFTNGVYDVFVNLAGGGRKKPLYGDVQVEDHVTAKTYDGSMLYMIGIGSYSDLPLQGLTDRLYFVYDQKAIYRWTGENYVSVTNMVLNPVGEWEESKDYLRLDMITKNGNTYVAKNDVPAGTPVSDEEYWMQIGYGLQMGTVTTVAASEGADAEIVPDPNDPTIRLLNLQIPRGVTGNESIDDTAGEGDTDYVWSAGKTFHNIDATYNNISSSCNCNLAIFKCAKTWVDAFYAGKIYYSQPGNPCQMRRDNGVYTMIDHVDDAYKDSLGRYPIDCSGFVTMCLMGIGFEESACGDGSNIARYPRADIPFFHEDYMKFSFFHQNSLDDDDGSQLRDLPYDYTPPLTHNYNRVRTWQLAAYFRSKGLYHEINEDQINDLQPGDILFYRPTDDAMQEPHNAIGHVNIYVGKGFTSYSEGGEIHYSENGIITLDSSFIRYLGSTDWPRYIVGYARVPFKTTVLPKDAKKIIASVESNWYTTMLMDRPTKKNDLYLIKFSVKTDESNLPKISPALVDLYHYERDVDPDPFEVRGKTKIRYDYDDVPSIFPDGRWITKEFVYWVRNDDSDFEKNLAFTFVNKSGVGAFKTKFVIHSIIPILSSEGEAIDTAYIDTQSTSVNNAALDIAWRVTSDVPQSIKTYVNIDGVRYVCCIKNFAINHRIVYLINNSLEGVKLEVTNYTPYSSSDQDWTYYSMQEPAPLELLESILP